MKSGKPSRTAWAAAAHRAAHQVLEKDLIFADPLALRILGENAETVVREAREQPSRRRMRIYIAARTRFAENALAVSVGRGMRQVVVLGAGLDTYPYRSPFQERLRFFEVDHPDTQAWKRRCLEDAAIPIPNSLTFAPIDFKRQSLAEGLAAAGFDAAQQTFFTWLGVVPYLEREAVWSTLRFIAGLPNGAHVVFDYSDPPASLPEHLRIRHEMRAALVADLGEAWVTYFTADELRTDLTSLGFSEIEDLGPRQIAALFLSNREISLPDRGGHILRATTI